MSTRISLLLLILASLWLSACHKPTRQVQAVATSAPAEVGKAVSAAPLLPWDKGGPLAGSETYALLPDGMRRETIAQAGAEGLLDVDLSDAWVPFIFSESDDSGKAIKSNPYRATFLKLASDQASPEELLMETPQGELAALSAAGISAGKGAADTPQGKRAITEAKRIVRVQHDRNYLEVYGIPPTLAVLLARIEDDEGKACYSEVDSAGLAALTDVVTYQSREQARREYSEAISDAAWVEKLVAGDRFSADATTGQVQQGLMSQASDPSTARDALLARIAQEDGKLAARIARHRSGQVRLRAIRAVQARLVCEGLLTLRAKHIRGLFDLTTNQALAAWERKNDIFGWGFLGGETLTGLQRPPMDLHLETFRRILMARLAAAAAILEDGSVSAGKHPATYRDKEGQEHPVPNLIADYADALLDALKVHTPTEMANFLRRVGRDGLANLHLAFRPPALPPYYSPRMDLSVEIDRGDVWYDFPFDGAGKPVLQQRTHFPSLTVFVAWEKQRIPLVRWRTTIGSWRSETHPNGKVYYKYKNSDVGPRVWKDIVAGPVWIPPESTPVKDLLTRKTLDRDVGPVTVVNTDVMGPGFQSAYGLVLAIHHQGSGSSGYFDNQIRTHGSDDYTSIARRYSHGCHRLVNSRAVRMFDFILRRRTFERVGNLPLNLHRHFSYEDKQYEFRLATRGYYYELKPPIPVLVTEGRILGKTKRPIGAFVPKPGVDYGDAELDSGPPLSP